MAPRTALVTARREQPRRRFPARTGIAEVLRVERLGPRMSRLILGGPALGSFFIDEPGEIVTLLWPAPDRDLVLPRAGWRFPPGVADAQHARNYTVRRWEPAARELVVDFVLHGDHGLAARWAAGAGPGASVGFAGPRVHWTGARRGDWTLLVADETGLPALAAIVETLPAGHPVTALVEVTDAEDELPLETAAALDVRWLHRGAAPPGSTTLIADALRTLDLPAGTGRAWGGGEAAAMRDVRTHLRAERRLEAGAMSVLGYWKHRDTDSWD
jgi:NADPH-dependent ferric siderophore reductase